MPMTLTEGLVSLRHRPISDQDRRRAALHVLDWAGTALIGATAEVGRTMIAWGATRDGSGAHAIGLGPASPDMAAQINGAMGTVFEMDDVHRLALLHPGPVIVPAALAAAETVGAPASLFLDAIILGYEATIRIGRAVGPGHYKFFHNTATCGPFGAAMAAGHLFGLSDDQAACALGLAGTLTGGFWQMRTEPNMAKPLHTARAAFAGLQAAELALLDFTGPRTILEGAMGFFAATCPDGTPDQVLAATDAPWLIWDTSFKPWPACRHAHPVIDAALILREKANPAQIQSLHIQSYRDALTFCDRPDPQTVTDAKFSLQHAAAVTLAGGPPPLSAFDPAAIADPAHQAWRAKVSVEAAEPFIGRYPSQFGASMTATMKDGSHITATVDHALGDPANPLPEDRIIEKARTLMAAAGLDSQRGQRVIQTCLDLVDGWPVERFARALTGRPE